MLVQQHLAITPPNSGYRPDHTGITGGDSGRSSLSASIIGLKLVPSLLALKDRGTQGDRRIVENLSRSASGTCRLCPSALAAEMEHHGDTAFLAGDTPHTIFRGSENGLASGVDDADKSKFGNAYQVWSSSCS